MVGARGLSLVGRSTCGEAVEGRGFLSDSGTGWCASAETRVVGVCVSDKPERRQMAYIDRAPVGRATKVRRQMRLGWLVVAVAACAVPVAQADNWGVSPSEHGSGVSVRPDDRAAGPRGGALTLAAAGVRADDRGGIRGVGSTHATAASSTFASAATRPDDRIGVHGFSPAPTPTNTAAVVLRIDNFQWADASIGAAIAVAAMMLLAGIALAMRRHRGLSTPVAP